MKTQCLLKSMLDVVKAIEKNEFWLIVDIRVNNMGNKNP